MPLLLAFRSYGNLAGILEGGHPGFITSLKNINPQTMRVVKLAWEKSWNTYSQGNLEEGRTVRTFGQLFFKCINSILETEITEGPTLCILGILPMETNLSSQVCSWVKAGCSNGALEVKRESLSFFFFYTGILFVNL